MLIQYAYIKPRRQFGKQCVFESSGSIGEENVLPDPARSRDYIQRSHCHQAVQKSQQFAVHEMQTISPPVKNTGMVHTEGGWPKEINSRDEEVTQRFRKRIEREEIWPQSMRKLLNSMESCIHQNNAVNIYESYFDDMIPTPLVMQYNVRTRNLYEDPRANVRPVSHLSWSPGNANRLAASYSFMEFQMSPVDVNPYSYVWDIENPNKALMALKSSSPLMAIEFNPRDPSMLISGLMTGQVCTWDIRIGDKPVQISHPLFSHRNPANQALWITSKTNTEFFSSSTSGTIKWWDIRSLRNPSDTLVMDLEDPTRADIVKAIGVSALQFQPSMGSRFMAGMQNGIVINVNRKGINALEKLAMTFDCCTGPVVAIDRNPFNTKTFLTVGDWSAKIWMDDTREGCLVNTCEEDTDLIGGCWSRARYSVFFTINTEGVLKVYDIMNGMQAPLLTIRICDYSLSAISPHEDGQLLAVGSSNGNIYLLECSEGLTTNTKSDKAFITAYLERCSRFQKTVDNRLKEIRLMYGPLYDDPPVKRASKLKERRTESKDTTRSKESEKGKEKFEFPKKKSKLRRSGRESLEDPELIAAGVEYFRIIEAESGKYTNLENLETDEAYSLLQQIASSRKKEPKEEKTDPKKERQGAKDKVKPKRRRLKPKVLEKAKEAAKEKEIDTEIDFASVTSKGQVKKRHGDRVLKKSCAIEVCKPEICCMDMEEALKAKGRLKSKKPLHQTEEQTIPLRTKAFFIKEKWYRKLSEYVDKIPERSPVHKRRILRLKDAPPNILRDEVKVAKKEVCAWQGKVAAGRHAFEKSQRKTDGEHEEKVDDERKTVVEESDEKRRISETKERQQGVDEDESVKKKAKGQRKGRKINLSPEAIKENEELEKRKAIREKIMREDVFDIDKDVYPRISAAFISRNSTDVEDPEKK